MSEKICDSCGHRYYRRNRLETWPGHNPGHRQGWRKEEVKLCTTCLPAMQTQKLLMRVLTVATVNVPERQKKKVLKRIA